MEENGITSQKRKGKFRSRRMKKRKGFHGKKAWEVKRENAEENRLESRHEPQPSTSEVNNSVEGPELAVRNNVSAQKLLNSSFDKFEDQGVITRQKSCRLGMGSDAIKEKARGFKLSDAELLSECISASAIL